MNETKDVVEERRKKKAQMKEKTNNYRRLKTIRKTSTMSYIITSGNVATGEPSLFHHCTFKTTLAFYNASFLLMYVENVVVTSL